MNRLVWLLLPLALSGSVRSSFNLATEQQEYTITSTNREVEMGRKISLRAAAELELGAILSVEVIQVEGSPERYAFEMVDGQGRSWTAVCLEDGEILETGLVLTAMLGVANSR